MRANCIIYTHSLEEARRAYGVITNENLHLNEKEYSQAINDLRYAVSFLNESPFILTITEILNQKFKIAEELKTLIHTQNETLIQRKEYLINQIEILKYNEIVLEFTLNF